MQMVDVVELSSVQKPPIGSGHLIAHQVTVVLTKARASNQSSDNNGATAASYAVCVVANGLVDPIVHGVIIRAFTSSDVIAHQASNHLCYNRVERRIEHVDL
jgi:hypothetical protein